MLFPWYPWKFHILNLLFLDFFLNSPLPQKLATIIPPSIGSSPPDKYSNEIGRAFSDPLTVYFHLPLLASGRQFIYIIIKFVILLNLGDIDNIGLY